MLRKTLVCLLVGVCCTLIGQSAGAETLMMATTTSTDNTGLLDELAPVFEKETGITLKWTAVGTGKALRMGQDCNVDVLLVHAPPAEKAFVENGYGRDRREIMYNDFVIIGPPADPAGVKGDSVGGALTSISKKENPFVSRGDDSGTHKKEKSLWKSAGLPVPDKESWYVQTGQGMLATIRVAAEKKGYTMTDRGTYIKYEADQKGTPPLVILVEGDEVLFNQYSVIPIDPAHCEDAQYETAKAFSDWLAGESTQKRIAEFKLLGKTLFTPNAE